MIWKTAPFLLSTFFQNIKNKGAMSDKYFKYVQWLLYLLMGLSVLFVILFYTNPSNPDMLLFWMYAMIILSLVVIAIVATYAMIKSPKGSVQVLIGIGGMILLGVLSYVVSKNTLGPAALEKYKITATTVKLVGAGLLLMYLMLIIAIGALIYTSVIKFFQK
jgi:vacuolar-type H+-ATPase subunit I/STV1